MRVRHLLLSVVSVALVPLLLTVSFPSLAQQGGSVGTVVIAKGSVTARDGNGAVRKLARKSEIQVHDTILVGADGAAQVRTQDNSLITFKPNTEFTFDAYSFDGKGGDPDQALMTMAKGAVRVISGTVGHGAGDTYKMQTSYASIGYAAPSTKPPSKATCSTPAFTKAALPSPTTWAP